MECNEDEKVMLLNLAHWAIISYPDSKSDKLLEAKFEIDKRMMTYCGCFVTIYIRDELRGCIGTFSERIPLYKNIREMSISAAYHDSRFQPIRKTEFSDLNLEISILSQRWRLENISDIEIGKHGIYLISGAQHGTLLPQVAEHNNWNREEFLQHCSRKARLNPDGWKKAEIFLYTADILSDTPLSH
jgi:AmmeMemoRadiSam system protein A